MYDPALGRFYTIDPKAEKFYSWTPFNYALNNPILIIEKNVQTAQKPETQTQEPKFSSSAIQRFMKEQKFKLDFANYYMGLVLKKKDMIEKAELYFNKAKKLGLKLN